MPDSFPTLSSLLNPDASQETHDQSTQPTHTTSHRQNIVPHPPDGYVYNVLHSSTPAIPSYNAKFASFQHATSSNHDTTLAPIASGQSNDTTSLNTSIPVNVSAPLYHSVPAIGPSSQTTQQPTITNHPEYQPSLNVYSHQPPTDQQHAIPTSSSQPSTSSATVAATTAATAATTLTTIVNDHAPTQANANAAKDTDTTHPVSNPPSNPHASVFNADDLIDPNLVSNYLDQVKEELVGRPDLFNCFIDIMKEAQDQAMDMTEVTQRVSHLFQGHPRLIAGFKAFLPAGFQDETDSDAGHMTPMSDSTRAFLSDHRPTAKSMEFNFAIRFVNKLKNRFVHQPYIFQEFLRILELYQTKRLPVDEVYARVQRLFEDDLHLMAEFEQFMPPPVLANVPEIPQVVSTDEAKGRRAGTDSGSLGPRGSDQLDDFVAQCAKRLKMWDGALAASKDAVHKPIMDQIFYDRVAVHLGNRTSYEAFLKILHLFNHRILDVDTVVEKIEPFLGNNVELFDKFKAMIGYVEKEKQVTFPKKTTSQEPAWGPSYRQVPRAYQRQPCSGRDELCWQVLNDEYVSHPTWASEDSGFISSKKNQFEEALHKVEEERYYHDLRVEAGLNAIAVLDRVAERFPALSPQELIDHSLSEDLGYASTVVYKRILKKIFDKEKLADVFHMLEGNPSQSVPTILKRLRQKVEEWKQVQNDQIKKWRVTEQENYYKALDYRGNTFKHVDKKMLSPKSLIGEIEALHREQYDDKGVRIANDPQLVYQFSDLSILRDISRLLMTYNDFHTTYNAEALANIRSFVDRFVLPLFDKPTKDGHATAFLGNDSMYCFFRLLQILYERLEVLKKLDADYQKDPEKTKEAIRSALPVRQTRLKFHNVDLDFSQGYYQAMLDLTENRFKNDIEHDDYEECIRYIFGVHGYVMFTINKIMFALSHQACIIVTDVNSRRLLELFKEQEHHVTDNDLTTIQPYQRQAEDYIKSTNHMYRMLFGGAHYYRTLRIYLLSEFDERDYIQKYKSYIASFQDWRQSTEGVNTQYLSPRFLKRNVIARAGDDQIAVKSSHKYKICRNTYHMFYVIDSEDVMHYKPLRAPDTHDTGRRNKWRAWLDAQQTAHADPNQETPVSLK